MSLNLDFSVLLRDDYPAMLVDGVITMLKLTGYAWVLAIVVGVVLTLIRMTQNRWAERFVSCYVEYHQNVPMLVQILLWYFGIPTLLPESTQFWLNSYQSEFLFAVIAIGLSMAAYISEGLRGGIRAIPKSQMEAARALGLNYLKASRLVILPQAVRIGLPTLVSYSVLLFKNTSLAMAIGVAEMTYVTREIESQSFRTVEVYLFSTVVYLGISLLIMALGAVIEKHYRIKTR